MFLFVFLHITRHIEVFLTQQALGNKLTSQTGVKWNSYLTFCYTFFISFENNCNNMTHLEVNIGMDQKNKDKESKQVFHPCFQSPTLWIPFLKCFHMGRRNNQNENKKIAICGMK